MIAPEYIGQEPEREQGHRLKHGVSFTATGPIRGRIAEVAWSNGVLHGDLALIRRLTRAIGKPPETVEECLEALRYVGGSVVSVDGRGTV